MIAKALYSSVAFLVVSSILSFVANQAFLYIKLKSEYTTQLQHDVFTMHTICLKEDIRSGLGEKNAQLCKDLEQATLLSPSSKALREVLNQTYLCGSVSCSTYIKELLQLLYVDIYVLIMIFVLVPICIRLGLSWMQRPVYSSNHNVYRLSADLPFDKRLTYIPAENHYKRF